MGSCYWLYETAFASTLSQESPLKYGCTWGALRAAAMTAPCSPVPKVGIDLGGQLRPPPLALQSEIHNILSFSER